MLARRVNGETVVVLGWGRAILMQLAHPLVAAGVGTARRLAPRVLREWPAARSRADAATR